MDYTENFPGVSVTTQRCWLILCSSQVNKRDQQNNVLVSQSHHLKLDFKRKLEVLWSQQKHVWVIKNLHIHVREF